MPSPRAAAVAVIAMLALGVALGSATSQLAQSAGLNTILLEVGSKPPPEEEEIASAEPEAEPEATASSGAAPESLPPETLTPEFEPEPEPEPTPEVPLEEFEEPIGLPEVKHVFLVVLGENGYEETFGATSPSTYLKEELPAEGELLTNYFAVTKGDLANQIALLSGQGPTLETAAECPNYGDVIPGTVSTEGQVEGNGCVYPAATESLASQLVAKKLKWKAYVEDMAKGAATGQPTSCRHPALGTPDNAHAPVPGDAYETWRNPFVYFHSVIDGEECATADVDLEQLAVDLKGKAKDFPALAYIVPNACRKGGELPCEAGQLAGPAATEEFLKTVVAEIKESEAYAEGGLIVITSSEARQTGATPDASSCCSTPTYPNVPPPAEEATTGPVKATGGGGRVGLLMISPFVKPGTVNETAYYNHFSLLRTIEEFFGLQPSGYAADPNLTGFEEALFNAGSEEESTVASRPAGRPLSRAVSALRSAIPVPGH